MRFADLTGLGLEVPGGSDPQVLAWEYLETNCPRFTFCGFRNGPGAVIESRELADGRYLILESPCFMEGLEGVFMGEVVRTVQDRPGVVRVIAVEQPLRFAHYGIDTSPRGSPLHDLIMGLGGEWESTLNGYLNYVHVPRACSGQFEEKAGTSWERLS
jgi:hypothetical protein